MEKIKTIHTFFYTEEHVYPMLISNSTISHSDLYNFTLMSYEIGGAVFAKQSHCKLI